MTDIKTIAIVCLFIFFAGLTDSIAGGGGLISLPAYIAAGVPPHMALASNKFSSTMGTLVSAVRYIKNKKYHLKTALIAIPFALVFSALGSSAVMLVDDRVLRIMLVVAVPCIAVFVAAKKGFGVENNIYEISNPRIVVTSALVGMIVGFYDGFFGPGTGSFIVFAFAVMLRLDLITASGNARLINLASNVGSLITFLRLGQVVFAIAVPAALFGILGNYVGSGLAIKNGAKIIRPVFIFVMALLVANIIKDLL